MLTADTGADEPKLHVSRKSITETREWGREKNKSLAIKYLSNYSTLKNQEYIFLPALKNTASDLDDKTGLFSNRCAQYPERTWEARCWFVPKKKHTVQHTHYPSRICEED